MDRSKGLFNASTSTKRIAAGEADFILRTGGLTGGMELTEGDRALDDRLLMTDGRLREVRDGVRGRVEKRFILSTFLIFESTYGTLFLAGTGGTTSSIGKLSVVFSSERGGEGKRMICGITGLMLCRPSSLLSSLRMSRPCLPRPPS